MTEQKSKKGRKPNKPLEAIIAPLEQLELLTQESLINALDAQEEEVVEVKPMGRRTPIHSAKANEFVARPGFYARQIVEKPGRTEKFLDAGYVIATDQNRMLEDGRIQNSKGLGNVCRSVVNKHNLAVGDSATAVWVEIPLELYEQDQEEKLRQQKNREDQLDPRKLAEQNPDVYYGAKYNKSFE